MKKVFLWPVRFLHFCFILVVGSNERVTLAPLRLQLTFSIVFGLLNESAGLVPSDFYIDDPEIVFWSLSFADCRTTAEILSRDVYASFIHDVCRNK